MPFQRQFTELGEQKALIGKRKEVSSFNHREWEGCEPWEVSGTKQSREKHDN